MCERTRHRTLSAFPSKSTGFPISTTGIQKRWPRRRLCLRTLTAFPEHRCVGFRSSDFKHFNSLSKVLFIFLWPGSTGQDTPDPSHRPERVS